MTGILEIKSHPGVVQPVEPQADMMTDSTQQHAAALRVWFR